MMAVDKLADPGCRRKLIAEVLCDPQLLAVTRDLDCFEVFAGVGDLLRRLLPSWGIILQLSTRPTMSHTTFALPMAFTVQCTFS